MKILFWVCLFFYTILVGATFAIAAIGLVIYKTSRFVLDRLETKP